MSNLPIPLPPLAEQRRIVAKVDSLMALCDQLEARLHERTLKQGELLQAVMAELAPTLAARSAPVVAGARGRGRPRQAAAPLVAEATATGERRGRGRPRKAAGGPVQSIPEASSMEEAVRKLEARKAERAAAGQVGLFEDL